MLKRVKIISILIVVLTISVYSKGFITISGNTFMSSDSEYKNIYSNSIFYPELTAGYNIYKNIFIWAGFGFISITGTSSGELQLESKSKRSFFSFGSGYNLNISKKLDLMLKAGIANMRYKEEAFGETISDNKLGVKLGGKLFYYIAKNFFINVSIGYQLVNDTFDYEGENLDIKLSGLSTGIGIGVKF